MRRLVAARRESDATGHGPGNSSLAPAVAFALCGGGPSYCRPARLFRYLVSQRLLSVGLHCARLRTRRRALACADARLAIPRARQSLGSGAHAGPAGDFDNVTWPGYVGTLTASAPGRFAACINQAPMWRRTRRPWLRPYDIALNARQTWGIRSIPPDHLLREVFETCKTFGEAKHRLETTPIARPVIYILVGCDRGKRCVIERTQDGFASRDHDTAAANDWLRSRPPWEARVGAEVLFTRTFDEAAENSRMRREHLKAWSGQFNGGFGWVSPPVLNSSDPARSRDVSCDRRAPGDRLRIGRRPGTAEPGNTTAGRRQLLERCRAQEVKSVKAAAWLVGPSA